jgi:diguanylate cyclase (GGDEF)-like protein
MLSSSERGPGATNREEFQRSLQLLDEIISQHLWGSTLMLLLLPGIIVLLPFLLEQLNLVRALLGMLWVASAITLYRNRRRLKKLGQGLIEQTDAATKNRMRGDHLYGLSILDPLTGLYNRRFGETRLKEEMTRVQESDDPLLVLALDFDRFKEINDKYGHAAGDLALKEFSRRLQRAIRACDVPIRVGGDEFLVIFPKCHPDKIKTILSRMGSIELTLEGNQVPVRFSHGLAQYEVNDRPETLTQRADERLYNAKAQRRTAEGAEPNGATNFVTQAKDSVSPSGEPENSLGPDQLARVPLGRVRRSSRIPKKIDVFLIGSDLDGKVFAEQTNTVELSRHGAGVISQHKLAPEQEMILRRQDTNKEAEVRVVRVSGVQPDSHTYGLAFVHSDIDIWDIEFPPLTESEQEAIYSLFECTRCRGRRMIHDTGQEEGSSCNKAVVQSCERCGSPTTWTRVLSEMSDEVGASVAEQEPQVARS